MRNYMLPSDGEAKNYRAEKYELQKASIKDSDKLTYLQRLDEERTFLINNVIPSVVCISTESMVNRVNQKGAPAKDVGSGVIVSHEGHIVTNNHVIAGKNSYKVALHDGHEFEAQLVGVDTKLDIAVLKINAEGVELSPLKFGDSDEVRVGQMVFAIGNPFGLGETVTQGIISAKERSFSDGESDLFQTDAAINPGNSGGPLVSSSGEVIGVNVAIYTTADGKMSSQGLGFSIPSNVVLQSFTQIVERGRAVNGYLGVRVRGLTPEIKTYLNYDGNGVAVDSVTKMSPAEKAGLRPNDVIKSYNGQLINNYRQLIQLIQRSPIDEEISLNVIREGDAIELKAMVMDSVEWQGVHHEVIGGSEMGRIFGRVLTLGVRVRALEWIEQRRGGDVGVIVTEVAQYISDQQKSAAGKLGLRKGDRIVSMDGVVLTSPEQFYRRLIEAEKGSKIKIVVQRSNRQMAFMFPVS